MNRSDWLTDDLIQAAFERRAGKADPADLRELIVTLSAASSQRSFWPLSLRRTISTLVLRPASLRGVATATVIGVIAVGAVFFVMRSRDPAVGGPSPSPSPSPVASPSASPPVAVASPEAPAWTATGTLITARPGHAAVLLLDGRVLVLGGPIETITPSNAAELYDPDTGGWAATGSMLEPRFEFTATLLPDGKVLVAGGEGLLTSAELYDPLSGTWTTTGAMATGRYGHSATLLRDGRVLVAGGIVAGDAADDQMPPGELYDPASGTWTATGAMAADRYGHTATLLPDGKVLVVGGSQDGSPDGPFAELYDPLSGTWTAAGNMATMRYSHTTTLLPNGTVLVAGGYIRGTRELCGQPSGTSVDCANPLASAELYDPQTGAWSATQRMIAARGGHTATLLPDGTVLVAGGYIRSTRELCGQPSGSPSVECMNPLASAELYDPQTGAWSATHNMVEPRGAHTATLLADGRVLVAGGSGSAEVNPCQCHAPVGSAELYDPASGTWSTTASMLEVRSGHTATLLPDGRVLVASGNGMEIGIGGVMLASAELYDPGSGN